MHAPDDARSILYVGPARGGVAHVVEGAAAALSARGWDVRHIALGNGRSPRREARRAFRRERGELLARTVVHVEHGSNDVAAFWFALLASRVRADIVTVVHDPPRVVHAPGAGAIASGTRWRDIVAYRLLAPLMDERLRRAYARRIAVAVVTSERARAGWITGSPARTLCLPLAYDTPPAARTPSRGSHVLFAGYITPHKGLDTLLDAWALVGDSAGLPLAIAGDSGRPDYLHALERRAAQSAGPPVRWLGALGDEDFGRAIADAAVVVVPYRSSNPASGVVLMAMAAGRAILGTDVPALSDFLARDREAVIVPVGDVDALARALATLLADPDLRDRLGAAAAARSARDHSWAAHCEALEGAYALAGSVHARAGVA